MRERKREGGKGREREGKGGKEGRREGGREGGKGKMEGRRKRKKGSEQNQNFQVWFFRFGFSKLVKVNGTVSNGRAVYLLRLSHVKGWGCKGGRKGQDCKSIQTILLFEKPDP